MSLGNDADPIDVGAVMVHAFRVDIENHALRRLVLSMALGIPRELMPDDEQQLLLTILDGG
jgi:hypothetical protein